MFPSIYDTGLKAVKSVLDGRQDKFPPTILLKLLNA